MRLKRRWQHRDRLSLGSDIRVRSTRLVVSVHDSTLDWGRLNNVLGHVSWTQVWAASLCTKFGLNIDSLLKKNTLQQRVLVSKHQALVGGGAVSRLEVMEVGLMDADGLFELLYVLSSTFTEGSLSLSVPLLSLFGSRIDRLAAALPLGLLRLLGGIGSRGYRRVMIAFRA
jgi:hypothetical protein